MKRLVLACVALVGCATAGPGNEIVGGLTDAGAQDHGGSASAPDAPPGAPVDITLSQTASSDIVALNSFDCPQKANSFFRVFTPRSQGVTNAFTVAEVDFGIQSASDAIAATMKILPYTGTPGDTLDPTLIGTALVTQPVQIAATTTSTTMRVPIAATIPALTSFAVELDVPGPADLYIGTNTGTETQPGYLLAPDCGINVPTKMQTVSDDNKFNTTVVMVLSVNGTH
jgi:hypothetical protein